VDKLDDKTLIKVYNETKEQTGYDFNQLKELAAQKKQEQAQNSSNYFSTPEQETSEDLGNLDMEALRKLLEEQGADPEILDKVDDQTLLQLIQNFQNF
jgi:replication initiation and membrane attachment protein DnaB